MLLLEVQACYTVLGSDLEFRGVFMGGGD